MFIRHGVILRFMKNLELNPVRSSRAALFPLAGLLALITLAAIPALAQDSGIRVNVGIAAAKPGDPIDIPLTLSGSADGLVGSLVVKVGVPKQILSYTGNERGLAVELAEGDLEVTTEDDKADSAQAITTFSAKGKSCIKPGILGYLKYAVSTSAQKSDVTLKLLSTDATACEGGAMQLAKGDDGQLTIFALDEQIPVVGCFFFTH
jgi:hypothetical protein